MTENELKGIARARLRESGYIFWFPFPRWLPSIQKWQRADIWEVFDLVAVKGKQVKFIQITTIQHLSDRRKKIQAFYLSAGLTNFPNAFIWAYDQKKGRWRIENVK